MINRRKNPLKARTVVRRAAILALEKQALDIVVLDLRKVTDFTDYFLVCTGVVDVHVKAIYSHIEDSLIPFGWKPKHVEGKDTFKWILLDYFDFVVHVLQPDARGHFSIEKLWGDASKIVIKELNEEDN